MYAHDQKYSDQKIMSCRSTTIYYRNKQLLTGQHNSIIQPNASLWKTRQTGTEFYKIILLLSTS